jgi:hypothetical protein
LEKGHKSLLQIISDWNARPLLSLPTVAGSRYGGELSKEAPFLPNNQQLITNNSQRNCGICVPAVKSEA